MLNVYGIANCDSVSAARRWLKEHGVAHEFHDLRKEHVDAQTLEHWLAVLGRERLVNKSSATWRTLERSQREQVESGNPVPVLIANPTLIKRPVLEAGPDVIVGFAADDYAARFRK